MRAAVAGLLAGLAVLAVLDAIAVRAGFAVGAIPDLGAPAWITSRAAGVAALVTLTADVVLGLFASTGAMDKWVSRARSAELHRWLSAVTLALVALHALVLGADRFVRLDALDATVPFLSSYERLAVGAGVLAAYGAVLVHASFGWVRRIGGYAWRKLHYVSFAVFALALGHALSLSGADGLTRTFAVLALAAVGPLVMVRVLRSRSRVRSR
jgi:methionine sulfoxide reductase heme-binding subunit